MVSLREKCDVVSHSVPTPGVAAEAWDQAVAAFRKWVFPLGNAAVLTARQRYFGYCTGCSDAPGFAEAAQMIAFGFLTRAAFGDARRITRVFGK